MTTTVANQQPESIWETADRCKVPGRDRPPEFFRALNLLVRQLRAAREQLDTARRQLESARQQPEIQLVQRVMAESFPIADFRLSI
jgi:hypothetical protein